MQWQKALERKLIIGKLRYDKREWHHWYAWRPVVLLDNRIAWLETVERKRAGADNGRSYWLYDVKGFAR